MCHTNNKRRKRQTSEGIEITNQETLREKEIYKYFGIMEEDTPALKITSIHR